MCTYTTKLADKLLQDKKQLTVFSEMVFKLTLKIILYAYFNDFSLVLRLEFCIL